MNNTIETPEQALDTILEMARECYTTDSLVDLFMRLEREGYSALGLGLIIDLVRGQSERAD